ncbi:hypothetical protein GQ600_24466 [Phytophthora cactorum]|nr:hypothetical protein GQ600_24466 [Phytophthora cactorum]
MALEYFSAEKDIEFDNLYPVYDHRMADEIDDFVAALPVKEMNAVYLAYKLGKEGSRHGFVTMLCWLQTSMEISETVDTETLHQHGWKGFKKERNHNLTLYLSMVMEIVSYMVNKVELAQWMSDIARSAATTGHRSGGRNNLTPCHMYLLHRSGSTGADAAKFVWLIGSITSHGNSDVNWPNINQKMGLLIA